ncbi:lamin tail domain-containing protein [Paenibacillus sp. LjRoot153]|uniref:lamin tail domain-containing protein n=1 Tax=Paenibacillus sp. LjRoot153 TaxID=3342270 RepID=UPI003ECD1BDF
MRKKSFSKMLVKCLVAALLVLNIAGLGSVPVAHAAVNPSDLVITEIVPASSGTGQPYEFVEIFNRTSQTIDLENFKLQYYTSSPYTTPGNTWKITGKTIGPRSYLVLWLKKFDYPNVPLSDFNLNYGVNLTTTNVFEIALTTSAQGLHDSSKRRVAIADGSGNVISGAFINDGVADGTAGNINKSVTYTYTGNLDVTKAANGQTAAPGTKPSIPTGLTATPSLNSVALSWSANTEANLAGYKVYLAETQQAFTVTGTTYSIASLTSGTTYHFQVSATDTNGIESPRTLVSTTTLTNVNQPPSTPAGLMAVAGPASATITWNANTESDLAGYKVYMNGSDISGTVTGTTYRITGLTNDTTYHFTITAMDTNGQESSLSGVVTATPQQYPALMITEVVPDSLKIDLTSGTPDAYEFVEIYNTGSDPIQLKDYKVIYSTPTVYKWPITTDIVIQPQGTIVLWAKNTSNSTTNTATLAGFNASYGTNLNTDQFVVVDALGGMANASPRTLSIAAPNDVPISTVSYDAVDVGENRGANFTYPTDGTITLRKLAYAEAATPGSVFAAQQPPSPSDNSAPAAPTGVAATARTNSSELSWNANLETDVAYYNVYMDGTLNQTLLGNHTTTTIINLQNNRPYAFEVAAVDTAGHESLKSETVTVTPNGAMLPKLLITELSPDTGNYLPTEAPTSYDAYEFIEIFNSSNTSIDLQGYKLQFTSADVTKSWEKTIDQSFTIAPRETKLIWTRNVGLDFYSDEQFNHYYFDSYSEKYIPQGNIYKINDVNGLVNAGQQTIAISDPNGTEIIRATYNNNGTTDFAEKKTINYAYPFDGSTIMRKIGTMQSTSPGEVQDGQVPPKTKTDDLAPAAPTGVIAVAGEGVVSLSWNANTESDLGTYKVYKDGLLDIILPAGQRTLNVPLLQGGITYSFEISALDSSDNESLRSAVVVATPTHQLITQTERAINPYNPTYQMLWNVSSEGAIIPGLVEDFVPQGMAYDKDEDWIIITSYMEDKRPSTLSIIDAQTDQLIKYVNLYDGNVPYNGHAGGVAVSKDHVWIASGGAIYQLSKEDLINAPDKGGVSFEGKFLTITNASFTNYADGVLWVGEYYFPPTYTTASSHTMLTRDNTYQYAWVAGYRLDNQTDVLPTGKNDGTNTVVPDLILSIPDKIQGMAMLNDSIMLSQSYSRSRDSDLLKYNKPDFNGASDTSVKVNAIDVPVWYMDSHAKADGNNDLLVPPMLENMIERDGKLYLLFESGANEYRDTANYTLDRLQMVDLTHWTNYGKPSIHGLAASMITGTQGQASVLEEMGNQPQAHATHLYQFSSSNPSVAEITATGQLDAKTNGETIISASNGIQTATFSLMVTNSILNNVTLIGVPKTIVEGSSIQLKVEAAFNNGKTYDVTSQALYSVKEGSDKVLVNTSGLLTAIKPGSTVVTATYGGVISGEFKIIVSPREAQNQELDNHSEVPVSKPAPKPETTSILVKPEDLTSANGKVIFELSNEKNQVLLPANTVELLTTSTLEITRDDLRVTLTKDALQYIAAQVTPNELKDGTISITINKLENENVTTRLNQTLGLENVIWRDASDAVDFHLSITTSNGEQQEISKFESPITVTFKINPDVDKSLLGIYYIDNNGELAYVGGKLKGDVLEAQLYHFSTYIMLEYNKLYADIPEGHWAKPAIAELSAKHIVQGVTDRTFEPARAVTRAEFAALLARTMHLNAKKQSTFSDVSEHAWYAEAVAALAEAGIVNGAESNNFAPDHTITREQMAVMLLRAAEVGGAAAGAESVKPAFTDEDTISDWAREAITKAIVHSLIEGKDHNRLDPQDPTSRAESAKSIYNLLKRLKSSLQ